MAIHSDRFTKKRICYLNDNRKAVDLALDIFEKTFKNFPFIEFIETHDLDSIKNHSPVDLVLIHLPILNSSVLKNWLSKKILNKDSKIPIPILFYSDLSKKELEQLWEESYKSNRYFDIINPGELDSFPIRIANLLKIYDHLHEIHRYEDDIQILNAKIESISKDHK